MPASLHATASGVPCRSEKAAFCLLCSMMHVSCNPNHVVVLLVALHSIANQAPSMLLRSGLHDLWSAHGATAQRRGKCIVSDNANKQKARDGTAFCGHVAHGNLLNLLIALSQNYD